MAHEFHGTGTAVEDAVLQTVLVANKERRMAELRVHFDNVRPGDGSNPPVDVGFCLNVAVWDLRHAAEVARHVKKVHASMSEAASRRDA